MGVISGGRVNPPGKNAPVYTGSFTFTGTGASSGVIASQANPEGQAILLTNVICRITTPSGGASTVDIGIAADAVTSSDTLIDGLSGAAAGVFNSSNNPGTNGGAARVWAANQFLNIAEASGDVNALDGTVYYQYTIIPS